jgi:hypothetical protein
VGSGVIPGSAIWLDPVIAEPHQDGVCCQLQDCCVDQWCDSDVQLGWVILFNVMQSLLASRGTSSACLKNYCLGVESRATTRERCKIRVQTSEQIHSKW